MFSNSALRRLIVPLFLEQLLVAAVGMADVFMVGFAGEEAVSGVSLVNAFNTVFINLFMALASGGAVVISQYIGKGDEDNAGRAASQLLTSSVVFSAAVSVVVLIFQEQLMRLMFGRVEEGVMEACLTYLRISAYSYPALAVYNAGAALYRSIGKTSTTMYLSVAANVINLAGNYIGVFILRAGVAGVAWPTFISRLFSALVITVLCFVGRKPVKYWSKWILRLDRGLERMILRIAVPNGVESGVFQLVKVALSSVAALFGTYQIAANGVAQSIWSMAALVGVSMGPAFITVIGQCMGAGDPDQAQLYFKKLTRLTVIASLIWNAVIFALTPLLMTFYTIEEGTKELTIWLVLVHNVFNAFAYPFADPLGKGLRATGDVKFTTWISLFTTVGVRLVFSYVLGVTLEMGVNGIAYAMCLDWLVRGIIFWIRFKSGKWRNFKVLQAAEGK